MAKSRGRVVLDETAVLARIDALVAAHGAVPSAEMRSIKRHLPVLRAALEARGHEIASTIRRPLEQQLRDAVTSFTPSKELGRHVAGGSAREIKVAVDALVSSGTLVRVERPQGPGVAPTDGDYATREELDALLARLGRIQKMVRKARSGKVRAAILREDLELVPRPRVPALTPKPSGADLADEIARRARQSPLPLRVPELLRSLGASIDGGRRALLEGVSRGLFELQPESGMGRLSREDAEWCPTGPMGTRLSWVSAQSGGPRE